MAGGNPVRRRRFILSVVTAGALAGCTGMGGERDAPDDRSEGKAENTPGATEDSSDTETGEASEAGNESTSDGTNGDALDSHPSTEALDGSPVLGPSPGKGEATVVAFEDPSCPHCADFAQGAFRTLRSEHVEPGELSFVSRLVPVIEEWATTAIHALWATYDRDEPAFWGLKQHYYEQREAIDTDSVLDEATSYLAAETDLDPDGVRHDVESQRHADTLDVDEQAARDADIVGVPTFFLFRSGSFRTEIEGNQNYAVFEQALQL